MTLNFLSSFLILSLDIFHLSSKQIVPKLLIDSSYICFQYQLLLYSMDGRCLSRYSAYEFALGIKSVCWSPSSQFLAVGSFDEKVFYL